MEDSIITPTTVTLRVPFETERLATIAKNSLSADQVPNPSAIKRSIETDKKELLVTIEAKDITRLRISLNNIIEAIILVQQTIEKFNPVD